MTRRRPRTAARTVLLDPDGRVLLIRSGDAHRPDIAWWELPGGGLEPGESPAEAAAREVVEETGYTDVRLGPPIGSLRHTWHFSNRSVDQLDVVFVAFLVGDDRQPQALTGGEIAEPSWVTRDELARLTADRAVPVVPSNLLDVLDWLTGGADGERPALQAPSYWPLAPPAA